MPEEIRLGLHQLLRAGRWLLAVLSIVFAAVQAIWLVYQSHQESLKEIREHAVLMRYDIQRMTEKMEGLERHKTEAHAEIRGRIESLQSQLNAHLSERVRD